MTCSEINYLGHTISLYMLCLLSRYAKTKPCYWTPCKDTTLHFTPKFLLKSIYYSIFNSHLIYACQIWDQRNNSEKLHQLSKLLDKALHIIHFLSPQSPLDHIYHNENVPKLRDFISLQNTLLINKGLFR